jgi:hypothetical protein
VAKFEGGSIIAAEKEGKYFLVIDGRTFADILYPEDRDLLEKMLTVYEFETEEERQLYLLKYFRV